MVNMGQRSKLHGRVIKALGGKCVKCGFLDIRALQIDHIKGGGNKEMKLKGYKTIYYEIIKNPESMKDRYQVLCANCNWIKRYENKEVPYMREFNPALDLTFVEYVKYIEALKNENKIDI